MVNEDGTGIRVEVKDRQLPCQTDRRPMWWLLILSLIGGLVGMITALTFAVILLRERESFQSQTNELRRTITQQDAALKCRAELNALLQSAQARAAQAGNDLLIEIASEFYLVVNRQKPDTARLREHIAESQSTLDDARRQVASYEREVGNCSPGGN